MTFIQRGYIPIEFIKLPLDNCVDTFIFLGGRDNMVDNVFCFQKIEELNLFQNAEVCYDKHAGHGSIILSSKLDYMRQRIVDFVYNKS